MTLKHHKRGQHPNSRRFMSFGVSLKDEQHPENYFSVPQFEVKSLSGDELAKRKAELEARDGTAIRGRSKNARKDPDRRL